MSFKGSGPPRRAAEMRSSLDSISERLRILGAPDDMIENLAWQWDHFDDDWTPERQAEMHHWSDDRLYREVTEILAEHYYATHEVDDPRTLVVLARRLAERGAASDVLAWVAENPELRVPAALTAERDGKQRGKLIKQLEAMFS